MIKNIIFDIGNVLADFRIMEFFAEKGIDATTGKRILKASVMSPYWEQFERCEITEEEAIASFAKLDPEIEAQLRLAYSNINGMLTIRNFAVPFVKALKDAGYYVYYLSNYSKKAYDECSDSLAFMNYMDGGLLSFQEGLTKPDTAFYNRFLERFSKKAEDCIFIDDTEKNVIIARELGFHGIVFQSFEQVLTELKNYGIQV